MNTIFYNIHVTDVSRLGTNERAAAGVTVVSTFPYLVNLTFINVTDVSFFPSSLYVKLIEYPKVHCELKMNRILVETIVYWATKMTWYGISILYLVLYNVTVRSEEYLYCNNCNTSSYNVHNAAFSWSWNGTKTDLIEVNNKCHQNCPYQASCMDGLKSRGDYWGLVYKKSGLVEFFQCPPFYCCTFHRDCVSYNTCTNNRRGRLCGDYKPDYSIALFGPNRCVFNDNCKSDGLWIAYAFADLCVSNCTLFERYFFVYRKTYCNHKK